MAKLITLQQTRHKRDDKTYEKFEVFETELVGNYSEKYFKQLPENYVLPTVDEKYCKFDGNNLPIEMTTTEKAEIDTQEADRLAKEQQDKVFQKLEEAKSFGEQIIAEFTISAGDETTDIAIDVALSDKFDRTRNELKTGNLRLARHYISEMTTDVIFTEQAKQYFVQKIQTFQDDLNARYA